MRILYGVQTTGRGHLVRSRAIIAALKAHGHMVTTVFSGPPIEPDWLESVFEPWVRHEGLTHVSINGRISYWATARQLHLLKFLRDVRQFDAGDADLVISDYEPITSRVAKRARLPSIGIGHLYAYAHPIPMAGHNLFNHAIVKRFAPADISLGLHWHHFGQPILPPMILPDVPSPAEVTDDGPVLVYLSFESLDTVVNLLTGLKDTRFRIYANAGSERQVDNVEILPIRRDTFLSDLARASGVICNTGFSLISEALHLGKRVLTKPVRHQTEQESNAESLRQLGLATVCSLLDRDTITSWLQSPAPNPLNYPDVMGAVLDWLETRSEEYLQCMVDDLWSRTGQVAAVTPDQSSSRIQSASIQDYCP